MIAAQGDTLVRDDEEVDDTTGSKKPFHYVRKSEIARSAVEGTHVVALCGEVFPVTELPKKGGAVCQECKRLYEKIKP